jgi:hypothetical protein
MASEAAAGEIKTHDATIADAISNSTFASLRANFVVQRTRL